MMGKGKNVQFVMEQLERRTEIKTHFSQGTNQGQ